MSKTWTKMPFFVGVQIWSFLFESDSNHPPLFQFSSLSRIEIGILSIGDSNPSSGCWILSTLSEVLALGIKYISKTLNSMISKHIRSVLVSSKSIKDQPWFNNFKWLWSRDLVMVSHDVHQIANYSNSLKERTFAWFLKTQERVFQVDKSINVWSCEDIVYSIRICVPWQIKILVQMAQKANKKITSGRVRS